MALSPTSSRSSGSTTTEIGYAEITTDPVIASTTEASPTLIVTLASLAYTANATIIEFGTPKAYTLGGKLLVCSLWDGDPASAGTNLGWLGLFDVRGVGAGTNIGFPLAAKRRLTPSAGNHTYGIYGYLLVGTAASTGVSAGAGGAATALPTFIRASLAA